MKFTPTASISLGLLIAAFTLSVFADEEKEQTVTLDQVPQKAKDTLKTYAADSDVKSVEKGDQDGKTVYEFEIQQGAAKFEVAISPKGKYMGREEDVDVSTLPDAVQKGLNAQSNGGTLSGYEKATDRHGKVTYEADVTVNGKTSEVSVDDSGKALKEESEDKD